MSYFPSNPNGQAVMASSEPVVLASDQSKVPVTQPDSSASISIAANSTPSSACTSNGGAGTVVINFTGTWTATLQLQITADGTNWVSVPTAFNVLNMATSAYMGSLTATGIYCFSAPGIVGARVITTAYTSGTVTGTIALVAGTAPIPGSGASSLTWPVRPAAASSGGNVIYTGSITNTPTAVKTSAGQVYGWHIFNGNAATVYVQFFNVATGSVTLGTTVPVLSIGIPAGVSSALESGFGRAFSTAISVAVTTTRAGSTAPASSVDLNIFYT